MTDKDTYGVSRRKLLAGLGTIGGASAIGGAATSALLWDEETFGNATNPNVLQAGQLDLKVDWDAKYYDWIDNDDDGEVDEFGEGGVGVRTLDARQVDPIDPSGPLFELVDVKPGDVVEATYSLHLYGNPAYLSSHLIIHDDGEGGSPPEPEATAEAATPAEDLDGTGGELDDHLFHVSWHDDGDNLPEEIWTGPEIDWQLLRSDGETEEDIEARNEEREKYVSALTNAEVTNKIDTGSGVTFLEFDVFESVGTAGQIFSGTLREAHSASVIWPEAVLAPSTGELQNVAEDFDDELHKCYAPTGGSVTEYVASLTWLPRDIPGVNDNVIQGDRVGFQFGFEAIQCRHNPLTGPGANSPADGSIGNADLEGGLSLIRRATSHYRDPTTAVDDGYLPTDHCVSNPDGDGAMGFHYVNPDLIDQTVNPLRPEVLIYANIGGGLELVAVEYLATRAFELFGHSSDPPHKPIPHSLHVWVWEENPDGVFTPFNPNMSCLN